MTIKQDEPYPLHQARLVQRYIRDKELSPSEMDLIVHPILRRILDVGLSTNGNRREVLIAADDSEINKFLAWIASQYRGEDGYLDSSLGLRTLPISDLLLKKFDPIKWLVEDMIASGQLVMIGGRPKSGKSWWVLQLAKSLDQRELFLDKQTQRSKVLYIALEDGERRVYQRVRQLKWIPEQAEVVFDIAPLDDGNGGLGLGIDQISAAAEHFDSIFLDSLNASLTGKADENDNMEMGAINQTLANIAHSTDTTIGVVHHTRKAKGDDVFNSLRGASAIRGAYDMGFVLIREQGQPEATLYGEGRDVDFSPMTIRQCTNGIGWEYVGIETPVHTFKYAEDTIQAMLENDPENEGMTAEMIAEIRRISVGGARQALKEAHKRGYVIRKNAPFQPQLPIEDGDEKKSTKRPYLWFVAEIFRQ
jgi:hypothetical protein